MEALVMRKRKYNMLVTVIYSYPIISVEAFTIAFCSDLYEVRN